MSRHSAFLAQVVFALLDALKMALSFLGTQRRMVRSAFKEAKYVLSK